MGLFNICEDLMNISAFVDALSLIFDQMGFTFIGNLKAGPPTFGVARAGIEIRADPDTAARFATFFADSVEQGRDEGRVVQMLKAAVIDSMLSQAAEAPTSDEAPE